MKVAPASGADHMSRGGSPRHARTPSSRKTLRSANGTGSDLRPVSYCRRTLSRSKGLLKVSAATRPATPPKMCGSSPASAASASSAVRFLAVSSLDAAACIEVCIDVGRSRTFLRHLWEEGRTESLSSVTSEYIWHPRARSHHSTRGAYHTALSHHSDATLPGAYCTTARLVSQVYSNAVLNSSPFSAR